MPEEILVYLVQYLNIYLLFLITDYLVFYRLAFVVSMFVCLYTPLMQESLDRENGFLSLIFIYWSNI